MTRELCRRTPKAGLLAMLGLALLLPLGCSRGDRGAAPYPHESLLSVLAELKIGLRSDPYEQEPARDLEGRNLYRVSAERLTNLKELAGAPYADVIAFAQAECLERLGDWSGAAESFGVCAAAGTSMAEEARKREEWARKLAGVAEPPADAQTLEAYATGLRLKRDQIEQLRAQSLPYPYAPYLNALAENTLRKEAMFLFTNRFVLPGGAEQALERAQSLADAHKKSYRHGEHLLLAGQLNEALALDYARLNDPSAAGFDPARWGGFVEKARAAYLEVAQTDGDPAKPEGQARLRALDAFTQRTMQRAR